MARRTKRSSPRDPDRAEILANRRNHPENRVFFRTLLFRSQHLAPLRAEVSPEFPGYHRSRNSEPDSLFLAFRSACRTDPGRETGPGTLISESLPERCNSNRQSQGGTVTPLMSKINKSPPRRGGRIPHGTSRSSCAHQTSSSKCESLNPMSLRPPLFSRSVPADWSLISALCQPAFDRVQGGTWPPQAAPARSSVDLTSALCPPSFPPAYRPTGVPACRRTGVPTYRRTDVPAYRRTRVLSPRPTLYAKP